MMGDDEPLTDTDKIYGEYLPCQRCEWMDGNGDTNYYYYYYEIAEAGGYVLANADGELLNDTVYEDAGCFYDQNLAPREAERQVGLYQFAGRAGNRYRVRAGLCGMDYANNYALRWLRRC